MKFTITIDTPKKYRKTVWSFVFATLMNAKHTVERISKNINFDLKGEPDEES